MSLLTDTDLEPKICRDESWVDKNKIHIYPFSEDCLTPVGYDLRVGKLYSSSLHGKPFELQEGSQIKIIPGETVLITTLEKIGMPTNRRISGLIMSKVSKVSKGLSHISTTVDPDWVGPLLIAMTNHSRNTLELSVGEPFCTLVFFENKSPATKSCGKPPGRVDVIVKEMCDAARKAGRKEELKVLILIPILIGIIAIFTGIGYAVFGNEPGFIAMTAGGVGMAQITLALFLRMRR